MLKHITNPESINLIKELFERIIASETIVEIERISIDLGIPTKNLMDPKKYPKINFEISKDEIEFLLNQQTLNANFSISSEVSNNLSDPFAKLLYAMAWKNGDLEKMKHIVKGIMESNFTVFDQEQALVFYQFGKYLTKSTGHPIIDQHVIRAFGVYKSSESNNHVSLYRKMQTLNKSHKGIIQEYISWLNSDVLSQSLRSQPDYTYFIDKLLFAAGKTIKLNGKQST